MEAKCLICGLTIATKTMMLDHLWLMHKIQE